MKPKELKAPIAQITLILVRHGHRDNLHREKDNGLTEKGKKQAEAIRDLYESRFGKEKALLLSSAKRRCQETLEPLSELLRVSVKVDPLLMETLPHESRADLASRIEGFRIQIAASGTTRVLACSHGDWIPEAAMLWAEKSIDCRKGSWTEFQMTGKHGIRWVETISDPLRQS